MCFGINYDNGFVVHVTMLDSNGYVVSKPIRKFVEQGHALIFKYEDCPHLSLLEIHLLVKKYNPNSYYYRINNKCFRLV